MIHIYSKVFWKEVLFRFHVSAMSWPIRGLTFDPTVLFSVYEYLRKGNEKWHLCHQNRRFLHIQFCFLTSCLRSLRILLPFIHPSISFTPFKVFFINQWCLEQLLYCLHCSFGAFEKWLFSRGFSRKAIQILADSLSPCRLSDVILFALSIGIPRRFKTPIY